MSSTTETSRESTSWCDAIEAFRNQLYAIPEVNLRLAKTGETYCEVQFQNGEVHWVERFSENSSMPGFIHFFCQELGQNELYEVLTHRDKVETIKWIPESHLQEDEKPPFGFAQHTN